MTKKTTTEDLFPLENVPAKKERALPRHSLYRYPWREMGVDQSFFVPFEHKDAQKCKLQEQAIRSGASGAGKRLGRKFSVTLDKHPKTNQEGVRVRRLA